MKKIILLILSSLVLLSCDKRKDFYHLEYLKEEFKIDYELLNSHSHYSAIKNKYEIIDTLKLNNDYKLKFKLNKDVKIQISSNTDDYLINNSILNQEQSFAKDSWIEIIVSPNTVGLFTMRIYIIDDYDVKRELTIRLNVFNNKSPITNSWDIIDLNSLSSLHKKIIINAVDPDEIYGGGISYYQYIINGDTTNYPDSEMNYIFPNAGLYNIGVRCKDNDDSWSNLIQVNNIYISD